MTRLITIYRMEVSCHSAARATHPTKRFVAFTMFCSSIYFSSSKSPLLTPISALLLQRLIDGFLMHIESKPGTTQRPNVHPVFSNLFTNMPGAGDFEITGNNSRWTGSDFKIASAATPKHNFFYKRRYVKAKIKMLSFGAKFRKKQEKNAFN